MSFCFLFSAIKEAITFNPFSFVLDLGCGEGRNSLFLAKKGFQVTSVDISKVGIRKLQNLSKKEKINLEATVSNIDSYLNNCKKFDAIYCMNVL